MTKNPFKTRFIGQGSVQAVSNETIDLLQKKYVLYLKVFSSLGQTLNYWVDWHLLKVAQPARQ
jgi:hypothetical protein